MTLNSLRVFENMGKPLSWKPTIPETEGLTHSLDIAGKGGPGSLENWGPVKAAAVTAIVIYILLHLGISP